MAIFTIMYGNYYPPHGEFELMCIGKFARRTWVNFTQQYGKNRQRCQQNKFTMLYDNYCYIFIENFPQKFSPCRLSLKRWQFQKWFIFIKKFNSTLDWLLEELFGTLVYSESFRKVCPSQDTSKIPNAHPKYWVFVALYAPTTQLWKGL